MEDLQKINFTDLDILKTSFRRPKEVQCLCNHWIDSAILNLTFKILQFDMQMISQSTRDIFSIERPKDVFRTSIFAQLMFLKRFIYQGRLSKMEGLQKINWTDLDVLKTSFRRPKRLQYLCNHWIDSAILNFTFKILPFDIQMIAQSTRDI